MNKHNFFDKAYTHELDMIVNLVLFYMTGMMRRFSKSLNLRGSMCSSKRGIKCALQSYVFRIVSMLLPKRKTCKELQYMKQ